MSTSVWQIEMISGRDIVVVAMNAGNENAAHLLMKHFDDDPEIATLIREMKALDSKQTTLIPRKQQTLQGHTWRI